jgi:REP element-mobilizing transposase RayT
MSRKPFVTGKFYHVFNRGVDKRNIFSDEYDSARFLESMLVFNNIEPIGSIYERSFKKEALLGGPTPKSERLVNIVAYCLILNHFHLILEQVSEGGISEFMKRLSGGYTTYFNLREERSGHLFQGKFKARHVTTDEYLLHLSAYVNLNDRVHQLGNSLGGPTPKLTRSSWEEYVGEVKLPMCEKDVVLGRFKNSGEYKKYAESALVTMVERKKNEKEMRSLMLE